MGRSPAGVEPDRCLGARATAVGRSRFGASADTTAPSAQQLVRHLGAGRGSDAIRRADAVEDQANLHVHTRLHPGDVPG
nr:hypothetical protein [Tolypothrix sp. NIES-4075]